MSTPQPDHPNVLLICTDHWPGQITRPAGHSVIMTPTIAQLAGCGAHYSNAYSACPVCGPARRSLMTGLTTRGHGDRTFISKPMTDAATLAGTFRNAGYQTCAVGKLHVTPQRDRIGFHEVILNEEGRCRDFADDYDLYLADQGYPGQAFASGMCNNDYMTRAWHLPDYCHCTNWTAATMCRMIHRRDPRKPGFWYMSFSAPHPPLWPLQSYTDLYRDVTLDEPVVGGWAADDKRMPWVLQQRLHRYSITDATPHEVDLARRAFYALMTQIDHQIRIVIGLLREQGLIDNTIIVFTSDHGDMLGDHRQWAKGLMYERSAKVPLVVVPTANDARVEPGKTDNRLAELRDIMPTLLDLAGIDIPGSIEGQSLIRDQRRDYLYGEIYENQEATRMIRDKRFKLIYYPVGNQCQLFDIETDPREMHDLSDDVKYASNLSQLQEVLIDHMYGSDEAYIRSGKLVGIPDRPITPNPPRNLQGQRGLRFI